jgi:hypothetical protein
MTLCESGLPQGRNTNWCRMTQSKWPLYRIRALKGFGEAMVGDLGGYVESERNLAQDGSCWVSGAAQVSGRAQGVG